MLPAIARHRGHCVLALRHELVEEPRIRIAAQLARIAYAAPVAIEEYQDRRPRDAQLFDDVALLLARRVQVDADHDVVAPPLLAYRFAVQDPPYGRARRATLGHVDVDQHVLVRLRGHLLEGFRERRRLVVPDQEARRVRVGRHREKESQGYGAQAHHFSLPPHGHPGLKAGLWHVKDLAARNTLQVPDHERRGLQAG